jgi:hypothetical protein
MPITFSFDIEQASITDPNDRGRINACFERLGWEHLGGSSWRYPALGNERGLEDWFNHVVPALMYFRSLAVHARLLVSKFSIDAHSETGYRGDGVSPLVYSIVPAASINMAATSSTYGAALSDERLRTFIQSSSDNLD